MTKFPLVSGRAVVKALERIGYRVVRQRGSHIRLHHEYLDPLTVPDHDEIGKGLLHAILLTAELSVDDFLQLL